MSYFNLKLKYSPIKVFCEVRVFTIVLNHLVEIITIVIVIIMITITIIIIILIVVIISTTGALVVITRGIHSTPVRHFAQKLINSFQ